MARNRLSSADGEGFLRAFTDAWDDAEKTFEVEISCRLNRSPRRGVVQMEFTACATGEYATACPCGRYQCEYPTAQVGTLEAALYQSLIRLERVLRDRYAYPSGKG